VDAADGIWNRACDPFTSLPEPGDGALQAVLRVHGQVMNGGLASAIEYQSPEEIESAMGGFGYFGRDELGQILREAQEVAFPAGAVADVELREEHMEALDEASYERLEQLEGAYNARVPRDDVLEEMFRERLRASPRDFAPLV
jgi:Domain of unknown function (DUF4375)